MRTVDDYCQAAMIRTNTKSLRQLADLLMISPTLPSQWKTRRAWPSDSVMLKLADLAGIKQEIALLELEIWRTSDDARPVYEKMLQIIAKTAAAILIALGLYTLPAAESQAAMTMTHPSVAKTTATATDLYIMRQIYYGH